MICSIYLNHFIVCQAAIYCCFVWQESLLRSKMRVRLWWEIWVSGPSVETESSQNAFRLASDCWLVTHSTHSQPSSDSVTCQLLFVKTEMGGPCLLSGPGAARKVLGPACTDNFQIVAFTFQGRSWHSVEQCYQVDIPPRLVLATIHMCYNERPWSIPRAQTPGRSWRVVSLCRQRLAPCTDTESGDSDRGWRELSSTGRRRRWR